MSHYFVKKSQVEWLNTTITRPQGEDNKKKKLYIFYLCLKNVCLTSRLSIMCIFPWWIQLSLNLLSNRARLYVRISRCSYAPAVRILSETTVLFWEKPPIDTATTFTQNNQHLVIISLNIIIKFLWGQVTIYLGIFSLRGWEGIELKSLRDASKAFPQ